MESDEEESRKITIPRFEMKTEETHGSICENIRPGALRGEPPAFNSRRHQLLKRPRTRSQIDPTSVAILPPCSTYNPVYKGLDLRKPKLYVCDDSDDDREVILDLRKSIGDDDLQHHYFLEQRGNHEPHHIAQSTPSVPKETYLNKAQKSHIHNISRKGNLNLEEAGCSSQTGKRTNVTTNEHALTYTLDKFSENHMIIFNHENFLDDHSRLGSAVDVASLRKTFEPLRFSVTVHNDLEKEELFTTLKKFSKQDFRRCGCICVAILTHGSDHGVLQAFDRWYGERELFACFDMVANSTLIDKPIIFLIQACRGRNLSRRVNIPEPDEIPNIELDSSNVKKTRLSLPAESNMITFHSSFFGKASARDRRKGSWFIQTVCEQIDLYAASEDLERIFLRVRSIVASEKEAGGGKQMPITSSALTKLLFLK